MGDDKSTTVLEPAPIAVADRIQSLDVLRGFALLGILLLNILGFGLPSVAYFVPVDATTSPFDLYVWAGVELFAEGAMRGLFSMLFGVGVVLFTTGVAAKSASIHYKRNFWLFIFGVFNAFVLMWNGDILMNYAIAGALLYGLKDLSAKRLLVLTAILLVLLSCFNTLLNVGLSYGRDAAQRIEQVESDVRQSTQISAQNSQHISNSNDVLMASDQVDANDREAAAGWLDFIAGYDTSLAAQQEEIQQRTESIATLADWGWSMSWEALTLSTPMFLLWDALLLMMMGMAFFKLGVFQGQLSDRTYLLMLCCGFGVGLMVNGYEVYRGISNDFDILSMFSYLQGSYHFGRLAMTIGYVGLIMLLIKHNYLHSLALRLAAVGRMALTNYLSHSLICLLIFSGTGFALLGELRRSELYLVVFAIWAFQLWLSPWWMKRFQYGPVEWLWRFLTYGRKPQWRK